MIPAQPAQRRRIRLINPNSPLSNITMPQIIRKMTFTRKALFAPTGLTICAAVMPRHWDVELVDECALGKPHRPKADVDVVAISAMTTQAKRAYAIADEYRQLGVTVILGGIHPSALPQEALKHCDAVCKGDAESTLPHLIADWEAAAERGEDPRTGIQSIYDWANFETAPIATPRKDIIDPGDYLIANPIQTTRGCPHNCNFCTTPAVFGRKFRQRNVADIVEEIRAAKERRRASCYIFADDNFGGDHNWAIELCEALRPLKVSWATQCDILISRNDRLAARHARIRLHRADPRPREPSAEHARRSRQEVRAGAIRTKSACGRYGATTSACGARSSSGLILIPGRIACTPAASPTGQTSP